MNHKRKKKQPKREPNRDNSICNCVPQNVNDDSCGNLCTPRAHCIFDSFVCIARCIRINRHFSYWNLSSNSRCGFFCLFANSCNNLLRRIFRNTIQCTFEILLSHSFDLLSFWLIFISVFVSRFVRSVQFGFARFGLWLFVWIDFAMEKTRTENARDDDSHQLMHECESWSALAVGNRHHSSGSWSEALHGAGERYNLCSSNILCVKFIFVIYAWLNFSIRISHLRIICTVAHSHRYCNTYYYLFV